MSEPIKFEQVIKELEKIAYRDDFEIYVNKRECEEEIADKETLIDLDSELDEQIIKYIEEN